MAHAQSAYKYRDANGVVVYTDRQPSAATSAEPLRLKAEPQPPRITVEQSSDDEDFRLLAINECECDAEFSAAVIHAGNVTLPAAATRATLHAALAPHTRQALLTVTHTGSAVTGFEYSWRAVLGTPGAIHKPPEPYRAPFAVGAQFRISQAYPTRLTHTTLDSRYAVDIAMPDGTPVYAARAGTVINVHHDFFRSAPDAALLDQANMVEILHDDGTIAIYAHLHWDSIRVQPGQSVRRGEYIADSGNTGFSTGPHLHFAVVRNAGMQAESVPIQFAGPGGVATVPQTGQMLTAY